MNINAPVPVGVLGASGYVGQELLRLLAGHPGASVAFATAESAAGERRGGVELVRIADAPVARAEIVLSALPHGVSARYVQEARGLGKRAVGGLIDQSREVVIDAASGVTGAGRTLQRDLLFGDGARCRPNRRGSPRPPHQTGGLAGARPPVW